VLGFAFAGHLTIFGWWEHGKTTFGHQVVGVWRVE
jgi:hypothetical protein